MVTGQRKKQSSYDYSTIVRLPTWLKIKKQINKASYLTFSSPIWPKDLLHAQGGCLLSEFLFYQQRKSSGGE